MGQKILYYLKQVFMVFAFDVCFLIFMAAIAGDRINGEMVSTLFRLGSRGLALETLLEFLFTSFVVNGLSWFFMSEWLAKKVRLVIRIPLLLFSILLFISGCILAFGWFPMDSEEGWLSFLIMFLICFTGSCVLMLGKKRLEDRKYERQLRRYKEKHGGK